MIKCCKMQLDKKGETTMAINTHDNSLLFSKKHSKQKFSSSKSVKAKASDIQSFTGTSIYETGKKNKIDSVKLKNSLLSNISFAGTTNAIAFGSGGGYGSYGGGYSSGPSSSQSVQGSQQTTGAQRAQATQRASVVNDDFNIEGLYSSDKVKKLTTEKMSLIKQYKDLQATIRELDAKKKEAVEMLAEIRGKVHQINIDILTAEEEELFK